MNQNMELYDLKVLDEFLEKEPPHLAMIRAMEAVLYKPYLPFKGKILDVGCGDGFFAWSVFKRQKITAGIDIGQSLWKEAKSRGNYEKVVSYDGLHFPFSKGTFNTVICNCVLEHVAKSQNVLQEINRVLKKDGEIIITVVTDTFGNNLLGTRLLGLDYKKWMNHKSVHVANVSQDKWLGQLKNTNFTITQIIPYFNNTKLMRFFDLTHYWGISNIITRNLFGKWVWGPSYISNQIWRRLFITICRNIKLNNDVPYLFIVAKK